MNNTMPPRERTDKNTPLYVWRMKRQYTLAEAAEIFGVSMSTYRRLESLKALSKKYALVFSAVQKLHPIK